MSRLIGFKKGGTLYYVAPDHLGSTLRVVDNSGNLVDDIRHHAFGATRSGGTNMQTDKRFTGQTLDMSTGLYHYGARSYDPTLARFAQPDTVVPDFKNPQSLNRYSYTINNPLRYTDPTGHYYAPAALTVSPVQAAPPPTGPTSGPAPVPAPTAGPAPALAATPAPAAAPQATPVPVPAPTPVQASGSVPSVAGGRGLGDAVLDLGRDALIGIHEGLDPITPRVAGLFTDLAGSGATHRRGAEGEGIHESVGGPTRMFMDNVLHTAAFTVGEDVFSVDTRMHPEVETHELGHVAQGRVLGPAYLPAYIGSAMYAEAAHQVFGGGRHFWNPMEQTAERLGNGRWLPWGTP